MSAGDRIENGAQKVVGKAKEAIGHVANNDRLVAEGKADQAESTVKDKIEDVKDVFTK